MTLDELRPILAAYRKQVEAAWSPATAHPGYDGKAGDPAGQCGVTSAWLQRRLREDHGIYTDYCKGPLFTPAAYCADARHCWLEYGSDRLIIDLTADQFRGLGDLPVVCDTYEELVMERWVYYEAQEHLSDERLAADPVQPRLAILTEALS